MCFFSAVIFYNKVYIFLFLFFTFLDIKFPRQTTGKMRSNVTHLKLKMRSNVVRPYSTRIPFLSPAAKQRSDIVMVCVRPSVLVQTCILKYVLLEIKV